jgi:hypothetical protein
VQLKNFVRDVYPIKISSEENKDTNLPLWFQCRVFDGQNVVMEGERA